MNSSINNLENFEWAAGNMGVWKKNENYKDEEEMR